MLNNVFINRAVYEIMWKNMVTAKHVTHDNTAHAHSMLDTGVYKRTLMICNTSCFSTAKMVERTCLNVTLQYIACLVIQCVQA
jgi:hypothetical protein